MFRNGRQHCRQILKLAAVAGPAGLPSNTGVRQFASEAGSASGSSGTVSAVFVASCQVARLTAHVCHSIFRSVFPVRLLHAEMVYRIGGSHWRCLGR